METALCSNMYTNGKTHVTTQETKNLHFDHLQLLYLEFEYSNLKKVILLDLQLLIG